MSNSEQDAQNTHNQWLNQIRSWENEIEDFERVNGQLASIPTNRASIEHWQNRFIVQKNRLDQMKHNIKLYGGDVQKGQAEMADYDRYFKDLRQEFRLFSEQSE